VDTTETRADMNIDEIWMQRCLDLAVNGLGNVAPNPMVGCVIVHDNEVIGEAFHNSFGLAHAEVNAIEAVKDKSLLTKSTLYVNLEPCSHHGKTPPCSDLIIRHGLKKVVIGALDSNELINGSGASRIKDAGIEVVVNVLKSRCRALNKRFYTFHEQKRPYYILKWAESSDGYIYSNDHDHAISNNLSNQMVHQMRSDEQAILIGKNTLIADNPRLNVRLVEGNDPLRIVVLGSVVSDIGEQNVFKDGIPTLIFNTDKTSIEEQVEFVQYEKGEFISKLNSVLYEKGIASVLVEGGTATINSFIQSENWDEAHQIIAQHVFSSGITAPKLSLKNSLKQNIGNYDNQDVWTTYINNKFK
jgi:diaminohydroxyphosphoribosylaminopyrimidine deaminase/5-amino-6-(5-phosphoribosylamino)uracil reductase